MATQTRNRNKNSVWAREAIMITVDARPPEYPKITVIDNKTNQLVEINGDVASDDGDEGVPYAFKAHQKVHKNHPAVEACPGAFMTAEEADELGEDLD